MQNLPVYFYFIALCLLVSLTSFFVKPRAELYLRVFTPFLVLTLTIEMICDRLFNKGLPNVHIYNYFTAFEFVFYMFAVRLMIESQRIKRIILVTIFIYTIGAVINIQFLLGTYEFHTITYSIGCLLVAICCIFYFLELFRRPKSVNLMRIPAFWICSGLLFFYCSSFPLFSLVNLWGKISPIINKNFGAIISILNIFLYSLFTIAFLCRIRRRKYIL